MKLNFTALFLVLGITLFAQTSLKVQIRPRTEYKNGFGTPIRAGLEPALYTSQRSRLTLQSRIKGIEGKFSFQDIRTWGSTAQLNVSDGFSSIHEAWLKFPLKNSENHFLKVGRMEVVYDDSRIFGNVDWLQQARSHDLAMYQYRRDSGKVAMDIAIGYNQNVSVVNQTGTAYTLAGNYKAIQFARLFMKWNKKASSSFILANVGFEQLEWNQAGTTILDHDIIYAQMLGTSSKFNVAGVGLKLNAFYQLGRSTNGATFANLNAYLVSLDASKTIKDIKLGLGAELQSGNDMNATDATKNNAFNPFFGTNHKFNGLMDYYYVGNHGGNVGLTDLNLSVGKEVAPSLFAKIMAHQFLASAIVVDGGGAEVSKNLGSEVDLVLKYKYKGVAIVGGYSRYFTTTSLEYVKGLGPLMQDQDWAWVMISGSLTKVFKD